MADTGPLYRDENQNYAKSVAHRNNHLQKGEESFGLLSINLSIVSAKVLSAKRGPIMPLLVLENVMEDHEREDNG